MELADPERQVLLAIAELGYQQLRPTSEEIRNSGHWKELGQDDQALSTVLGRLLAGGLVDRAEDRYSLTAEGSALAKQLSAVEFGRWMTACEHSPAYLSFCQKVYGASRCQFNMMTEMQLGKLLEVLQLGANDRVLDLGCGIGTITEQIADLSGAAVVGVDFSEVAIQAARARTRREGRRLAFEVMDIDDLHFPDGSLDAVVAIDTLYFVRDLPSVVAALGRSLRDRGRMALLYTTHISPEEPKGNLAPRVTPLGKALQSCGLRFQTWDFTEDEWGVWERQQQVAEELKAQFEAEGNAWIYQGRVEEAEMCLSFCRTGRSSRYLYHVWR